MEHKGLCNKCVMDTSSVEITFDEKGVCNFCHEAQRELSLLKTLKPLEKPQGKPYTCLIGLSGGVDSSYALHMAIESGHRPLCFTIDNGYNKPEADENIMRLVETLKVPFFRYTINLERFKDLQSTFIRAGVPNIEIPTDHILLAASLELAAKYGIKTIISGGNVATESIMPASFGYSARDAKHIKSIYQCFAGKRLRGLPICNLFWWNIYKWYYGIRTLYLLDYI